MEVVAASQQVISLEDMFRDLPRKCALGMPWTVTLGTKKWPKPYLVLSIQEECDDGKFAWNYYGRIDAVTREHNLFDRSVVLSVLNTSKETSIIFELEPKMFAGEDVKLFFTIDEDNILKHLKGAFRKKDFLGVADLVTSFIEKRHSASGSSAMKKAEAHLRSMFPEKYPLKRKRSSSKSGRNSSVAGSVGNQETGLITYANPLDSREPDSTLFSQFVDHGTGGSVAGGSIRGSVDPSEHDVSRQTSSYAPSGDGSKEEEPEDYEEDDGVEAEPVAGKKTKKAPKKGTPKTKLQKVPTQLETQEALSQEAKAKYQEELFARCGVQENTMTVDIAQLHKPVRDHSLPLPLYQVRHIQTYFLSVLTKRMKLSGASPLAQPFVLLVDPRECRTREDWDFAKKDEYHYYVIGGNHSACAKADLALLQPNNRQYRRVTCFIFAGLTVSESRNLAWCSNIDSEFRSKMTNIQRLQYIHMRFVENGCKSNIEFKSECAMEISLKDWGIRKNAEVLNCNDNLFQLAFRGEPEWSYIRQVFDKWEECKVKGQKPEKEKKKSGKDKGTGDAKAPYEDMKLTEWRIMQPIKDSTIIIPVLKRVIDGEISLAEMAAEFNQHKVGLKVQKAFLVSLQEETWDKCKKKYPEHCTDNFLQNFVPTFSGWV